MSIRIRKQSSSWVHIVVLGALLAAGVYVSYHHFAARAFGFGWVSEDPTATVHESTLAYEPAKHCIEQDVFIGNTATTQDKVCVYQANGWRYGIYKKWINEGWRSYWDRSFVISIGGDSRMYRVEGLNDTEPPLYIPNSSNLVYTETTGYQSKNLWIIKDLLRNLIRYTAPDFSIRYRVKDDAKEFLLKNEQGLPVSMVSAEASINGRWLAVEVRSAGLVIFDMRSYTFRYVSKYQPTYGTGKDAQMLFSISDDGSYFAYAGIAVDPHVMELTPGCGTQSEVFRQEWRGSSEGIAIPCPERRIWQLVNDAAGGDTNIITAPFFNYDGGQLTVYAEAYTRPDDTSAKFKWITLTAAGYAPTDIDYLAMGDSYASGEGDILGYLNGNPVGYFISGTHVPGDTDIPREMCHVSPRSYPFLIRNQFNMANSRMKSIACSGAEVADVYSVKPGGYYGQPDGTDYNLARLLTHPYEKLKAEALTGFIPGRERQTEFLIRHRPKAATISVGGNDAGFGSVLQECASMPGDCIYVSEPERRNAAGLRIQDQYTKLTELYTAMRKASPQTKIYAIGYPKFIDRYSLFGQCAFNAGILSSGEKEFIDQGVDYMNNIVRSAAITAGVKYIDIDNALFGGRLCEGSQTYVTGLWDINVFDKTGHSLSFHPNAQGHVKIAEKVLEQLEGFSPISYPYAQQSNPSTIAPELPAYFDVANNPQRVRYMGVTGRVLTQGGRSNILVDDLNLEPDSTARITLRSEPVYLGVATANGKGGLGTYVTIPENTPVGYHTVEVAGSSYSGEEVVIKQSVLVQGNDPVDRDDNGIVDTDESCLFIPESIDTDNDDVDDACDPEITKPPTPQQPLYRARYGDTVRPGEKSEDLVIERSIETATAKQMPVDADQDADGWAVVGKSNAWTVPGNIANFTFVDDKPALSVRTDNLGCVRYRPMSLNVVEIDQVRNLAYEAINTNTCRSQSLESDMDANGLPDNTQPLYRARNGDPGAGERANVVYLERSRAAAESQLGLSDYTPLVNGNLQSWNLIAKTILPTTYGTYKKLLMVNDKPVILVEGAGRKCITLAPLDDGVIRRSLQPYMPLIKQPKLAQGQNCG